MQPEDVSNSHHVSSLSLGAFSYTSLIDEPGFEEISPHRNLENILSTVPDYDEAEYLHPLIFRIAAEHLPLIPKDFSPEEAYELLEKLFIDVNSQDLGIELNFNDLKEILLKNPIDNDSFEAEIVSTYETLFELAEIQIQTNYFLSSHALTPESSQIILGQVFTEATIDIKASKKTANNEKLILSHMGAYPQKNDYQAKLDILAQYYEKNPKQAVKQFKKQIKSLIKLNAIMKEHYSVLNINLLGKETLNRMLLSNPEFTKFLQNPDLIKAIIAMEVIESMKITNPQEEEAQSIAKESNKLYIGFSTRVSTVVRFCLQSHPNSLYLIVPNGKKLDPNYLKKDEMTRKNLLKMTQAVYKTTPKNVSSSNRLLKASCFDAGYQPQNWNNQLFIEFSSFCTNLKQKTSVELKKFAETRKDLSGWVERQGPEECKAGMKLLFEQSGISTEMELKEVVKRLAYSPAWLQPLIAHLCLDRLHFGAIMMLGDNEEMLIQLADQKISCADLFLAVADYLHHEGVNKGNAIAAEALFSRMALVKDYGIEELGWYEFIPTKSPILQEIEDKFGPTTTQNYFEMIFSLNSQLKGLTSKYGTLEKIVGADDKELAKRLTLLQGLLTSNPHEIIQAIHKYHQNPMFQYMGPLKFISFLAQSHANLPEEKNVHGLTSRQRVALYGYTTGDYAIINPAMRKAKEGKIEDPGLAAYVSDALKGMLKLPDFQSEEDSVHLERSIFTEPPDNPLWGQQTFIKNNVFKDFAFVSTTPKSNVKGAWNLTYTSTKGAKDVGRYSAWPGENEILILPGIEYIVDDVDKNNVILKLKED
ncbi:ADP-ribosyltransferase [Candidatus Protochlamydia sp. W-9]|uniref:ADP-ribosyltransferase n=1 Tax=Candidatus Protochlamydia sp. W-9 TaxID=1785087 RepID=UPI00096A34A4|nr:ADP-ribosyltransferase [Candidatus Protochlamydia sp. W-9]